MYTIIIIIIITVFVCVSVIMRKVYTERARVVLCARLGSAGGPGRGTLRRRAGGLLDWLTAHDLPPPSLGFSHISPARTTGHSTSTAFEPRRTRLHCAQTPLRCCSSRVETAIYYYHFYR